MKLWLTSFLGYLKAPATFFAATMPEMLGDAFEPDAAPAVLVPGGLLIPMEVAGRLSPVLILLVVAPDFFSSPALLLVSDALGVARRLDDFDEAIECLSLDWPNLLGVYRLLLV
jgi:hypothetical protein